MRSLIFFPILVAAGAAACSKSPTGPEQPKETKGAPSFAVQPGVCANSVTYFFTEIQWTDVSTGFVFGHVPPHESKVAGVQEYGLTLNAAQRTSLIASFQGGCSADVHVLAQGYTDASGDARSRYGAEILVGWLRAAGGKQILAQIEDAVQNPPLPPDCSSNPTPDACVYDYDHAISLFPVGQPAPKVGDQLRVRATIVAHAQVRGVTSFDEAGAAYMVYRNGPSMPKLVITLP